MKQGGIERRLVRLLVRRAILLSVLGVVCGLAQPLAGQPLSSASAQATQTEQRLSWEPHWRRVGLLEYVVGGVAGAGAATLYWVAQPQTPRWDEAVLFDEWVRDRWRLSSRRARSTAERWSDAVDAVSSAHLFVIDSWVVPAAIHRNPDVGLQLFGMNLQSYGVSMLLNRIVKRITRRARPFVEPCERDPRIDAECGSREANVSFYSGHSSGTATSAGLICAHHTHLALYGGGAADAAACVFSVSLSLLTGGLRIASDNHWATDVVVGHLMGGLSGYVLPSLLYYRGFGERAQSKPAATNVTPFIWPGEHSVQFGMFGYF